MPIETKITIQPGTPACEAFQKYREKKVRQQEELKEKAKDAKRSVPNPN